MTDAIAQIILATGFAGIALAGLIMRRQFTEAGKALLALVIVNAVFNSGFYYAQIAGEIPFQTSVWWSRTNRLLDIVTWIVVLAAMMEHSRRQSVLEQAARKYLEALKDK